MPILLRLLSAKLLRYSLITWLLLANAAFAGNGIVVLFPDIPAPYRNVFDQIMIGVEAQISGRYTLIPIKENIDINELNNTLRRMDAKVIISLGRNSFKIAAGLDSKFTILIGGIFGSSFGNIAPNIKVNHMAPDPAIAFSRLKKMLPRMKRVFVVYDPRQNEWLISVAKEAARNNGMELVAIEARDIRTAVQTYQEIFQTTNNKQDSLWIIQDASTVDEAAAIPMILQEAWQRAFTLVTTNSSHVKRGALFALFPNTPNLGRYLANTAVNALSSSDIRNLPSIIPLRELSSAVNSRTAKHVEANLEQQSFDSTYPEQ